MSRFRDLLEIQWRRELQIGMACFVVGLIFSLIVARLRVRVDFGRACAVRCYLFFAVDKIFFDAIIVPELVKL